MFQSYKKISKKCFLGTSLAASNHQPHTVPYRERFIPSLSAIDNNIQVVTKKYIFKISKKFRRIRFWISRKMYFFEALVLIEGFYMHLENYAIYFVRLIITTIILALVHYILIISKTHYFKIFFLSLKLFP